MVFELVIAFLIVALLIFLVYYFIKTEAYKLIVPFLIIAIAIAFFSFFIFYGRI